MPAQPTYPGVYVEELSFADKTIRGVPTSITAFVGRARKGPTEEPINIFSFTDYERIFGGLWNISTMSFAVRDFFLNGGAAAIIVRIVEDSAAASGIKLSTGAAHPNDEIQIIAVNAGAWGNKLSVVIEHKKNDIAGNALFSISIAEEGGLQETFFDMSTEPKAKFYLPRVLEEHSKLVRVKKNGDTYTLANARPVEIPSSNLTGGNDGAPIGDVQICSGNDLEMNQKGMYALEKADLFNLLCIPPYTSPGPANITPGADERPRDVTTTLIQKAVAYCRKRRAMFIVDPHSTWTSAALAISDFCQSVYPATTSDHSALFFPGIKQLNPLTQQLEVFAPCGAIAGVFARTDVERGVWKAPAGVDVKINGIDSLSVPLTDNDNGTLNSLGINCLRTFSVYGSVVWGARTLAGADQFASEWKYIPVRRTALFIEESLYRGTGWVVFEPNNETLWAQVRLNVGAFMHVLFRQGAFHGASPRDAYFVKCDSEINTQNDINAGSINIMVGFAALKPAEFVMIYMQLKAGEIQA